MSDEVRAALARSTGESARRAARRSVRRHCVAAALGSAASLLAVGALDTSLQGTWTRALLNAVLVGALVGLVLWPLQLEPVRARMSRAEKLGSAAGGVLVFAVPAGIGHPYPLAYPIGAAAILAFWLVTGWWLTRER